jgi:membrane associated rhomboid family serine protease
MATDSNFAVYGIRPKEVSGLIGILTSPLIHADFTHLFSNTIPLLVLGIGLFYLYTQVAFEVFFLCYVLEGLLVWCFGRTSYHIGASGLVYGLVGFLFFSGILRNNRNLMTISLLIAFMYGGVIWGVLPLKPDVSWESHLAGASIGTLLSFYHRNKRTQIEEETLEEKEEQEIEDFTSISSTYDVGGKYCYKE